MPLRRENTPSRRPWQRQPKPARLAVTAPGIGGNATVILGTREAIVVKAAIICGTAGEWIDVMQPGGRLSLRTSSITAAWIEGGSDA